MNGVFQLGQIFRIDRAQNIGWLLGRAHIAALLQLFGAFIKMLAQQQEFLEFRIQIVPCAESGFLAFVLRKRIIAEQVAQRVNCRFHVGDRFVFPDEQKVIVT